jgi:hypothetical protein
MPTKGPHLHSLDVTNQFDWHHPIETSVERQIRSKGRNAAQSDYENHPVKPWFNLASVITELWYKGHLS